MAIELERLAEILNNHFGEPFLAKDGVRAEYREHEGQKELMISIGRRDIQINETGEVVSTGTFVLMPNDLLVWDQDPQLYESGK